MAQKLIPDVLALKRSQPVQGKPVNVKVEWNGEKVGYLHLPFAAWIKLNRLLGHGVEMDKKEDRKLNVRVKVEGLEDGKDGIEFHDSLEDNKPAAVPAGYQAKGQPYRGGISNMAAGDDDEDIKAAERQARLDEAEAAIKESQEAQQQQLVRSLRPATEEGGENDG